MVSNIHRVRVLLVHVAYILYSTLLWWRLIDIGRITNHPTSETRLAFGIWMTIFLILNCFCCFSALGENPHEVLQWTWCNIPMLFFIVFNVPPFGFTLRHLYEVAEQKNMLRQMRSNQTCVEHEYVPMSDFILLQMVMPVLLATFITYPLPRRCYTSSEYLGIAVEFMNAFDIMDMIGDVAFVEKYGAHWVVLFYTSLSVSAVLVAFPIKIENEDFVWPRQFVICSHSELTLNHGDSMSSILTTPYVIETETLTHRRVSISPGVYVDEKEKEKTMEKTSSKIENGLEEKKYLKVQCKHQESTLRQSNQTSEVPEKIHGSDSNKKTTPSNNRIKKRSANYFTREVWKKLIKATTTMIFMDMLFACIRFKIMVTEGSAEHGFNMFVKNVILSALHMSYLLQHVRTLIVTKLVNSSDK